MYNFSFVVLGNTDGLHPATALWNYLQILKQKKYCVYIEKF